MLRSVAVFERICGRAVPRSPGSRWGGTYSDFHTLPNWIKGESRRGEGAQRDGRKDGRDEKREGGRSALLGFTKQLPVTSNHEHQISSPGVASERK